MKSLKIIGLILVGLWLTSMLQQSMVNTAKQAARGDQDSQGSSAVQPLQHEMVNGLKVIGTFYTPNATNIRASASGSAKIVRKTSPGERLRYVDASGDWYRVIGPDTAATEWVHQSKILTEFEYRQRATAHLEVGAWSWHEEYSYAIAEGQVTNVSSSPLEHVTAVVTFHTADGTFITSDNALIEYDPLLPGQSSPWKVMARWNPAMKRAELEFATLGGGTLRSYTR